MKVAMIGCGNMGTAYVKSLLKNKVVQKNDLLLIDKDEYRTNYLNAENLGEVANSITGEVCSAQVIVLAIKPQFFVEMAPELKKVLISDQIVISIMAGVSIETLENHLGHDKVVRAMPNTPCQIGMGVTAYTSRGGLDTEEMVMVDSVLKSTGRTVYIDNESLMDVATALSGSGPAYFFKIIQHMIQAGVDSGMSEATASLLVKQTMLGSYHLMNHSDVSLEELTERVTSRGGTTEAALNFFAENGLEQAIKGGIEKARDRGIELSKG